MQLKIEDVIEAENKVVLRNIWYGTHRKTGEKFHKTGIVILRFNNKYKIAERWSDYTDI